MGVILAAIIIISVVFVFISYQNNQNVKTSRVVSIDGKGDYSSIHEAVDSASDNDTIFVSKGIYFENINITKPLELIGEDKDTTIIDGNGSSVVIDISADYVKISGFTITNSGSVPADGIKIGSSYDTISDCNISLNKNYGIYLYPNPKASNNIIKFDTFYENGYGIYTNNANVNNISSNIFTYNTQYGVYLELSSNDNILSENRFTDNNYAIRVRGSMLNTIINNWILNNNYGLYFCCGGRDNIAYDNVFMNNAYWNANDAIGNTWDNGVVGNYWDDYTGVDENGDGIGDTSYSVYGGSNLDNYPLMQPI